MKNKYLYITGIAIFVISVVLLYLVRTLQLQSIVENNVLSAFPDKPRLVLNFKNPDELYHHYLTQNSIFKKMYSNEKLSLLQLIKQIDSVYVLLLQNQVSIQEYSFYFALYNDVDWLIGFAVKKYRDIKKVKEVLLHSSLYFEEREGNFWVFNSSHNLNWSKRTFTSERWRNWLSIFSKHPSPLHIYELKDTVELAYQVFFELQQLKYNGFIYYKNISNYLHYPKSHLFSESDLFLLKSFQFENVKDTNEYVNNFLDVLHTNYLHKMIQTDAMTILPLKSSEKLHFLLESLSDSVMPHAYMKVYQLKKSYIPILARYFPIFSDSTLLLAVTENQLLFLKSKDALQTYNYWLNLDVSKSSYYTFSAKHITSEYITTSGYFNYIPIAMMMPRDTVYYDFYADVSSSLSGRYFAFELSLNLSHKDVSYLWTYHHNSSFQKIIGVLDDHKTNSYFVLVQDSANHLLCLEPNGEWLWTYHLKNPVRSDVFVVDIFKNNKHQVVFNTDKTIYLLDRNGKDVGRFPLNFSSEITSPVQVFDYGKNKNYRIWFSTKNHYTYNYTLDGKMAEQFRPVYFDEMITRPVYFASVGVSDYIVLISQTGKIVGISRKGEGRFKLKTSVPENSLDVFYDVSNTLSDSYLYYCTQQEIGRIAFTNQLKIIHQWSFSIIDALFVRYELQNKNYVALLDSASFVVSSLKGEEMGRVALNKRYTDIQVDVTPNSIYYVLKNDSNYLLIKQTINNQFIVVANDLYSTILPRVFNLNKTQQNYLLYAKYGELICQKID